MLYSLFDGFKLPLGEALLDALLGIAFVFIVLAFLVCIFSLYNYIYAKMTDKNTNTSDTDNIVTADFQNETQVDSGENEDELTAVIIAAISAVYESEQKAVPPFKVKNIKLKY